MAAAGGVEGEHEGEPGVTKGGTRVFLFHAYSTAGKERTPVSRFSLRFRGFVWLPRLDSNQQPFDYSLPLVSGMKLAIVA